MGVCATGVEYHEQTAMVVMVGAFPENSFRILPNIPTLDAMDLSTWNDWFSESHFAIVHGDPGNVGIEEMAAGLARRLPGGFLAGGLSSSHELYVQIANQVVSGGLSGVVFRDEVAIATGLTQGCSLIGKKHHITDCEDNIISAIDGQPALDVFREDIGEVLARDLHRVAGYIFAGLPVTGSDTGDYLVRNLVGVDPNHKLLAIGELVHKDQPIQFCRRDGGSAREDMTRMLDNLKKRIDGIPRGGVYFSCLGRGPHLFGEQSDELQIIRKELGDFPLVGFYANGEFSNDRLYGYTGVLTLFL